MQTQLLKIDGIPAVLYGAPSDKVFFFLHGKCGNKEEAADFAALAVPSGWQVLSVDLPGHGVRKDDGIAPAPWTVLPELAKVSAFIKAHWLSFSLRANSIGAWFSMLAFAEERPEKCLFVSPILDMPRLIADMLQWAGVTREQLRAAGEIETAFGETLSQRYADFAQQHPITAWTPPTDILWTGGDTLTARSTVTDFAERFHCRLTVMEDGEHWFHTPQQMEVLRRWTEAILRK